MLQNEAIDKTWIGPDWMSPLRHPPEGGGGGT